MKFSMQPLFGALLYIRTHLHLAVTRNRNQSPNKNRLRCETKYSEDDFYTGCVSIYTGSCPKPDNLFRPVTEQPLAQAEEFSHPQHDRGGCHDIYPICDTQRNDTEHRTSERNDQNLTEQNDT